DPALQEQLEEIVANLLSGRAVVVPSELANEGPGEPAKKYAGVGRHRLRLRLDMLMFWGRREDYGEAENQVRARLPLEVASYDRLLDALSKLGEDWDKRPTM